MYVCIYVMYMYCMYSMYCTLSGTGPLPMESPTPPPPETTRDDVPGPSGEWSHSLCLCVMLICVVTQSLCRHTASPGGSNFSD